MPCPIPIGEAKEPLALGSLVELLNGTRQFVVSVVEPYGRHGYQYYLCANPKPLYFEGRIQEPGAFHLRKVLQRCLSGTYKVEDFTLLVDNGEAARADLRRIGWTDDNDRFVESPAIFW